jgi:hypothetical protein
MRFLFGIVVGVALTVALAWLHDNGTLRFGPEQAFVNWTVVMGMDR